MKLNIKQMKYNRIFVFQNTKNLLDDEEGNSMVEFAMVLPLLIVLTVGTIFLSINYSQKSVLNGLAFMETRAASVRQQHEKIAEHAVKNYIKSTQGAQPWLAKAKSEIKDDIKSNDLTIIVSKDAENTELLANALNIIGGRKPDGKNEIKKIKSAMVLPIEYITLAKRSDRPYTSTTVNYETKPTGGDFLDKVLLDKLPDSVKNMIFPKSLVDPKSDNDSPDDGSIHDTRRADGILGADPTRNMERLGKAYSYWGLDKVSTSEAPEQIGFTDINFGTVNKLGFMKVAGDHIAVIEKGTDLLQVAAQLSGFGFAVESALKPFQGVAAAVLPIVEDIGNSFADKAEKNNNAMFKPSIIGR